MNYILFTYDAVRTYLATRKLQSIDFTEGKEFSKFFSGEVNSLPDNTFLCAKNKDGVIIYTEKITKDKGLLFDLTTFKGFSVEKNDLKKIATIILKVFRYAVKYFESMYLSQNERYLKEQNITLVYPYPFTRTVDVPKVVVDCNNWKESTRKGYKFLTVYDYQTTERSNIQFTSLGKAVKALQRITISKPINDNRLLPATQIHYSVTGLSSITTPLSANLGAENWDQYLSTSQKTFVERSINGPERLEGAAGSGKTLALCLRVIRLLKKARKDSQALNLIYFTHSISTKEIILDILRDNCEFFDEFLETDEGRATQSVKVCTLQEWCAEHLGINDLNETEYLDKDAGDSKLLQLMHIEEAWIKNKELHWKLMSNNISNEFKALIESSTPQTFYEMLQREFSEIIKGQAKSKLDNYLKLKRPQFSLTLANEYDRRYVFQAYSYYQNTLDSLGQFDSDDIVITALGQIDAPIWNRRRMTEGYDACFIDETHLFNLNEISVFHFVNKPDKRRNIIFCIDHSQSIGDSYRADTNLTIDERGDYVVPHTEKFNTIFRSTPDIAALAFSILTSGATMFATLENPLLDYSALHDDMLRKLKMPVYYLESTLEDVVKKSFEWAQNYCDHTSTVRNKTLIVSTDEEVLSCLVRFAEAANKPYIVLKGRNDHANIKKAINDNRFIIASIDHIGGLEFDAVALAGVDGARVPPTTKYSGSHIINFAWFNRLYVAVTRAKYAVAMIGESANEISPLLKDSIDDGTIVMHHP